MFTDLSNRPSQDSATGRWQRQAIAEHLQDFHQAASSLRDFADLSGVPKSTLHDWNRRSKTLHADPITVAFLESPQGLQLLHALVLAAHLVFSFLGHAGLRPISHFLELAGLSPFLATSYGAQQTVAEAMNQQILAFEAEVRPPLAAAMPHRTVTICEDETFPKGQLCLVAREPVSGFLLAERFTEKRDADTWNRLVVEATTDLKITLLQQTSDEAAGLTAHARQQGLHHSPDLFHLLRDSNLATVLPLQRRREAAEAALMEAQGRTQRHRAEQTAAAQTPRPPGRPPNFLHRIAQAEQAEAEACGALEAAEAHIQQRQEAIAGLSSAYHPFDLETGAAQGASEVERRLRGHFEALSALADAAELPQRSRELLAKSRHRFPQMVETVAFFWSRVEARVGLEKWSLREQLAFHCHLLPATYLMEVAQRSPDAETRQALKERAHAWVKPLLREGAGWERSVLEKLESLARECAGWFQRSSSCVEGRNGELALSEHARRGLSEKRLKALTVVSNYVIVDSEGTTAAQRFFGQSHTDLFQWLLDHMPLPTRPRKDRPRLKKQTLLGAA